jgi:DNA-binding transcriptional ArsR family regulator
MTLLSYDEFIMETSTALDGLTSFYKLLSNRSRLAIVLELRSGEANVAELCHRTGLSQTLVSHQLAALRNADILRVRRAGKHTYYQLADEHIMTIVGYALEHLGEKEV